MNLLTLLDMAAAGHGDRLLLGTSARGLTGEQLAERSRRGARFLTAAGAQTVVYIGENGLAVPLVPHAERSAGDQVVQPPAPATTPRISRSRAR